MALTDRIGPICDLLLGAAYADQLFKDRERVEVREMLAELLGTAITPALDERIASFTPASFDVAKTAAVFADDPEEDRMRLLHLVSAIHDVDEEIDMREDDYLRALGTALALPASALEGLTVHIEVTELRGNLEKARTGPPPPPKT